MSLLGFPFNEALTPGQIELLKGKIRAHQDNLKRIEDVILEEQEQCTTYDASIAHLKPAIASVKSALTKEQHTLNSLFAIGNSFKDIDIADDTTWAENSEAKGVCEAAMARIQCHMKEGIERFNTQIQHLENNVTELSSTFHDLQRQLCVTGLLRHATFQSRIGHEAQMKVVEDIIKELKSGIHPIKRIPEEILTRIFSIRLEADMEDHFDNPTDPKIPHTMLEISHVCHFWRQVATQKRDLWRYIAVYPNPRWIQPKVDLFRYLVQALCPISGRFFSNITRNVQRTPTPWHRSPPTFPIESSEQSMHNSYCHRVLANGSCDGPHPSELPFRQPFALAVQFVTPPDEQFIFDILECFNNFQFLEISSRHNFPPVALPLSSSQPQLRCLKLDLATFKPFDISEYLGPELTELHLMHNGTNALSPPPPLQLPQLRTLGVTPPDTQFIHSMDLARLSKVILYGPKVINIAAISLVDFLDHPDFPGVQELELRNWRRYLPEGDREWEAMTALGGVVEKLRLIVTLSCVDSYIYGPHLVEVLEKLKDNTKVGKGSLLEKVVIDCCSGITQDNCERIHELVGKLDVFV